ncbi:MAG: ferredoxin [Candidatus Marinimicrobia bacterium]|nr:ferredoxin [Candidatus Neomarinimicrobiota bacterium]MBT4361395.1 ferredoxin [Candidatus Neomarinimicrobiota bacterium]MBT4713175.1 ferredoxin [Candidatus Neomarinimicrobiota bacterium]MBT4947504.1 ferredoxin [Candidatus Neomarinimicrobiota bacterium]MBT5313542.1 ferredoxin [Candidatus Neomarinimicrobiota bacterium]
MKKNSQNMGSGGNCHCPKCDYSARHRRGVPCQDEKCPECGAKLIREGSYHDDLLNKRQEKN